MTIPDGEGSRCYRELYHQAGEGDHIPQNEGGTCGRRPCGKPTDGKKVPGSVGNESLLACLFLEEEEERMV